MLPFPMHSAPTLGRFPANASRALVPLHVTWLCGRTSEPRRAAFHLALPSLCFHTLTNRFSRKPFVFTSIQIAQGVMTPRFPRRIPSCNHAYGSTLLLPTACSLFGVLKKVKPRIFSHLQPLSTKHPGWGGASTLGPADGSMPRTRVGDPQRGLRAHIQLSLLQAQGSRPMDEATKLAPFPLMGDADPVPASLFASYPEQANTLSLLYEVSREITSILDREELLRRVAQRVKKLVNYHVFSVMLWDEKTQQLESAFVMRYGDAIPVRMRVPLHQGLTGAAAAERRSVRVADTLADPRFLACEVETGVVVRSELVVPLLMQDRLIGVLDLESAETHAFTAEHERMLVTLASYVAIALENARLYEEARQTERRLNEDLSTAREIQRQLLPTGAREVPGLDLAAGYCSARELGGDFYDFLPYGKGRLAVALGDVSGKGTAAALFGSLAIGTMREHVAEHPCPPPQMLALLNRRLYGAHLDSRFIAMAFAVYDAGERRRALSCFGARWRSAANSSWRHPARPFSGYGIR